MLFIIALVLVVTIAAVSLLSWFALKSLDDRLVLSQISVHQWRRGTRTVGVILIGGIGLILVVTDLIAGRL